MAPASLEGMLPQRRLSTSKLSRIQIWAMATPQTKVGALFKMELAHLKGAGGRKKQRGDQDAGTML